MLLPLARLSVPTFIVMSPARPVSDVLLLILAPFERLTVPTFSSTFPPRPLLLVLLSIETLFMVNASAVIATCPASPMADRLKMRASPEISTESATMVTFPPGPVLNEEPVWITAPSVRMTVLACTSTSPERAVPWVSETMPEPDPERATESAMLPTPNSPCTVTVAAAGALGSALPVEVLMVAPPERLAC